jgi:hypothetical protein
MQGEKLIKKAILISTMSSVEPLREVVQRLAHTFNDPQIESQITLIFMMIP